MSLSSMKNKISKRIRTKQSPTNYQDIGSYIKRKRKEQGLTQDNISNGICSISYLSKIENNQINPNEFYVKEIMEKLEVEESIYETMLIDKEHLNGMVEALFYRDSKKIESIYEEIKDVEHNMIITLCKTIYLVYHDEIDHNQYIMILEHLITNMTDFELATYLLVSGIYFYNRHKLKLSLEMLLLCSKVSKGQPHIDGLCNEYTYYAIEYMNLKRVSSTYYDKGKQIYQTHHNTTRMIHITLHKAFFISKETPKTALKLLQTIKHVALDSYNEDFYNYVKALSYFYNDQFQETTICLKRIEKSSSLYFSKMVLLYQVCLKEEDMDMATDVVTMLESYQASESEMKQKIYYHYLLQKTKPQQKEYLRDIAIPFSIKISDFIGLQTYVDSMIELCSDTSRYKEAITFYQKYKREKEKISQLLIG